MEKDYPASHSADTEWFILDDCGHVASCYSNESGAIPNGANTHIQTKDEHRDEIILWESHARASCQVLDPGHLHKLVKTFEGRHTNPEYAFSGLLMVFSDFTAEVEKTLDQLSLIPAVRPTVRFIEPSAATDGKRYVIVSTFETNKEAVVKLHALGLCVTCTNGYHLNMTCVGAKDDPIFHYGHPSANGAAHPYMLQHVPENPKVVDDLSLSAQEKNSLKDGLRFKGCFRDKIFWQPTDDFDCELYNGEEDDEDSVTKVGSETFKALIKSTFGYW